MDGHQFLSEFVHIANAPGGVARLRKMIYQLAVLGSLSPPDEDRREVDSLLVDVASTRERLIRERRYKRMSECESEPVRPPRGVSLPPSWRWTRLLDVGEVNPRNNIDDEEIAAFLPMSGVTNEHRGPVTVEKTVWREIKKGYTHFSNGDVLLAKITPCFENGKAAFVTGLPVESGVGAGSTELLVFRPIHKGILAEFVYLFLRSALFAIEGEKKMTGTAGQKRLPTDYFATRALPLPPTRVQSWIVQKVDELMTLCDKLETQQEDRRKLQNVLRQATFQAISAANNGHELQARWTRLDAAFDHLYSHPDDLADLRKCIRDLAVSGHLCSPDHSDEHATTLKQKISESMKRGIGDGSIPHRKPVMVEELQESVLPTHWTTITVDEAISTIDAGWSPACLPTARSDESKWGVLRTTAVQTLRFLPDENKELPITLRPRPQYQIEVGDILITRAGPKNRVGACCVVDVAPRRLMISDKLIRFHIVDDLIDPYFVALCLSAGEPGRIIEKLKTGMAESQMNISQDRLRSITIPLPAIQEQRRLLRVVAGLMGTIDALEAQFRKAKLLSEMVATSAVFSLIGISIALEEEGLVKAPRTELLAPIQLGLPPQPKADAPLAALLARHEGSMSAADLLHRFGGGIDAFYAQLKTEVTHGWIREPGVAQVREHLAETTEA